MQKTLHDSKVVKDLENKIANNAGLVYVLKPLRVVFLSFFDL